MILFPRVYYIVMNPEPLPPALYLSSTILNVGEKQDKFQWRLQTGEGGTNCDNTDLIPIAIRF